MIKGKKYAPGTHWTQRPENKERLAKVAKLRHKKKSNTKQNVVSISPEGERELENNVNETIQYSLGYIEAWFQNTAKLHNIPEQYLTARVAELLLQSRKRAKYNVPNLRKNAA